ncbi:MAG: type III-B CRISPR module-associated protein Cmr3 [Deltaproteobacteria bacterium]|nr:type III-B CRISPR module-associated protein Cmr3 [Deltaproteobacteria bacterium]
MNIFIQPTDVLMFRDGKPFSAGDDHLARSIVFPPPPTTFYGALRSKILSEVFPEYKTYGAFREGQKIPKQAELVVNEIGTPDKATGSLRISSFLLGKKNKDGIEPYFPMPKDMAKVKGQEKTKLQLLAPLRGLPATSNAPAGFIPLWCRTENALERVDGFLNLQQMQHYLYGETHNQNWDKLFEGETIKSLYMKEVRTGIGKGRESRTVSEGALYSVEYFRLADGIGFLLAIDGTQLLPKEGKQLLRLGGDWRSAYYEKVADFILETNRIKEKIESTRRFKVILTTPAIFKNGWLPSWVDVKTMEGERTGLKFKIVSAAVGKPVGIGGFNLVERKPKTMKKAVPAGSVFFFELVKGDAEELFSTFYRQSISDENAEAGLGLILIGGWNYV